MKLNLLFVWLIIIFASCGASPDAYIKWYNKQKGFEISTEDADIKIKEIPPELIYLKTNKNLTKEGLQKFNMEFNIRQISVEIKHKTKRDEQPLLYGLNLEAVIDKYDVKDIINENSIDKAETSKFILVTEKMQFDTGKNLEIAHPKVKKVLNIPLDKIRINNKKQLSL